MKGLEYATDCKAVLVGKPNPDFFMCALENTRPEEAVMIGDVSTGTHCAAGCLEFSDRTEFVILLFQDVRDDIGAAQRVGIRGILVKTGKYRENDENLISPLPMATVDDFSKAVDTIIDYNSTKAAK